MPRKSAASRKISLAIHGGAGALSRARMTPQQEQRYRTALAAALAAGWRQLRDGATGLDAVCAAVVALEDDALFNAGRGAALNADARVELDASVMDGATRMAGAVAALRHTKNPVLAARAVMETTPHVLLAGPAADRYAHAAGCVLMPDSYFHTLKSAIALERARAQRKLEESDRHGTVGAVACDCRGDLAAATSTGGYTNKMAGRVGDSALIGAGTYADNAVCAVSCTGHGETFIRMAVAYDIAARVRYGGQPLRQAVAAALAGVAHMHATGGVIAVNRRGTIALAFNTEGMYRAWRTSGAQPAIAIFHGG